MNKEDRRKDLVTEKMVDAYEAAYSKHVDDAIGGLIPRSDRFTKDARRKGLEAALAVQEGTQTRGNFEAVDERTDSDNFHTSIYESDYDGLLIARCNQNGAHPYQVEAILNGLNGKQVSADLIAQQAAELDRLRRELEEARKALEPFANLAESADELTSDGEYCRHMFTYGQLRAARAALRAGEEGK